jgi:hypothetical protein
VAVTRAAALPELDAARYTRHALHAEGRTWVEKNCYVDIWIELVHALGLDPVAMMAFTLAIDFEDDQWTFFKPVHSELWELYGVDVQELNVWQSILEHAVSQVGAGKLVATEADAWWLPDTSGTDYRAQHTKTSIIINDVDVHGRRLGYFHNAAYHSLEGEDFARLFRVDEPRDAAFMPLFAELIRIDRRVSRPKSELANLARSHVRRHLARRPKDNPVARFGQRFAAELPLIQERVFQERGLGHYHAWAFANLRQLGAAFELAAAHMRWHDDAALVPAAEAFEAISNQAQAFILKAARAVNAKRALDATATFDEMAQAWQRGMDLLVREVGVSA